MHRTIIGFATILCFALAGCNKGPDAAAKDSKSAAVAAKPLLISPEDLLTVASNALTSGPSITGSIQPERRADLRAEVSAVVLQVLKENGDTVKQGQLLVRLDDTAIRDSLASADEAARAAGLALDQAERQFQRLTTLRGSGMASAQQLDDAETRRNSAQSDVSAAKTRAVQARQQLQRTEARAPFDGVVSERKVSAGDTAQIGKELLKVIDPASMRFEGLVSADKIGEVKAGQNVSFRVNGYGAQSFLGKVKRVNPAANATTRQVEVLVAFAEGKQPGLSGLYAEGRIEAASIQALFIPETAMVRDGDKTFAWRVAGPSVQKIVVVVGERDARSGHYVLLSGAAAGDQLLRSPTIALKDGQQIELTPAAAAAGPAPAPPLAGPASATASAPRS